MGPPMSATNPSLSTRGDWSELEDVIADFEGAWQRAGGPPDLDAYLRRAAEAERPRLLVELAHTDLEYRLKAGYAACVEMYWHRFPALADDRAAVLDLIAAEFRLRQGRQPAPTRDEYRRRFPLLAGALSEALEGPAEPAALTPTPALDLPTVSGYEVLGELGQGGMGVVYKARQRGLGRLVALKMILARGRAGPDEFERFRREAEAVARLQHPNIIQIYEVGSRDGQPFFSMEYVEGGGLDKRLAGSPQPPREAARLARVLAEAVHYAHEHGVVHRDLKPANVLLAGTGATSPTLPRGEPGPGDESPPSGVRDFGVPKVTDFGLAKRLDAEVSLTPTDAILGTPSYMAPEQAAGRSKDIGPAADVYALGAILYELLTGRPPFRGASFLDTLEQVRSQEPVPPSRLQPKLARDLETICLKCLRKEPHARYSSARALADDLGRYLDDLPVRARPTPGWERAAKWARRRPAWAALIAVVCAAVVAGAAGAAFYNAQLRHERDRARADRARALQAADALVTDLAVRIKPIAGAKSETVRAILDSAARVYDDLQRAGESPEILEGKAKMLAAFAEVYLDLNDTRRSAASAREAVELYERLAGLDPDNGRYRGGLARAQDRVGWAQFFLGDLRGALASFRSSKALRERLTEREPDNPEWQSDLGHSLHYIGNVLYWQADYAGARAAYQEALSLRTKLVELRADDVAWQRNLGAAHEKLGDVNFNEGDFNAAAEAYRTALGHFDRLLARDRDNADHAREWVRISTSLAETYQALKKPEEARKAFEGARDRAERFSRLDPGNTHWEGELLRSRRHLVVTGPVKDPIARAREKREVLADLLRLCGARARQDPANAYWKHNHADMSFQLGRVLDELARAGAAPEADADEALRLVEAAVAAETELTVLEPTHSTWAWSLWEMLSFRADLLAARQDAAGARATMVEAWRFWLKYEEGRPRSGPDAARDADIAVATTCHGLAKALALTSEGRAEAGAVLERGRRLLLGLKEQGQLPAQGDDLLGAIDAARKALEERP